MSAPADRTQAIRVLAEELRAEVAQQDEVASECRSALARFSPAEPGRLELLGVGALLQSFYNGVERVLTRIAPDLNGGVPSGLDWHRRLLDQMTLDVPGTRPAALRAGTAALLDEYRGFRHRFRNLYFFELRWDRCGELLRGVAVAWRETRDDLLAFIEFLDRLGAERES